MNPFVSRITNNQAWVLPVSALSLVLGFMIVVVSKSSISSRFAGRDPDQRTRLSALESGSLSEQQQLQIKDQGVEINGLRREITRLQTLLSEEKSEASRELNESLQTAKSYAGLTELQGPGVLITLNDATDEVPTDRRSDSSNNSDADILDQEKIIHDQDILRVVNELYAAGAEAISVNNLRLVESSSIRCVGPTVLVDAERIASPIKIRAIGNPETLLGGLKMPGGVYQQLQEVDPRMVTIEDVKEMTLPAYSGPTTRKWAKDGKSST
jgi:uncharacterized protein YlxW (UPF0749 family)